jgi:hypothetical protein
MIPLSDSVNQPASPQAFCHKRYFYQKHQRVSVRRSAHSFVIFSLTIRAPPSFLQRFASGTSRSDARVGWDADGRG